MNDETTAAEVVATTEVESTPVESQTNEPIEQVQVDQSQEVSKTDEVTTEENDFTYVPKKFMKDGKPDFAAMAKSYQHLEKKASQKGVLVPEDIAEYEWSGTSPVQIDEELQTSFKTEAQKVGLTKEQYAFVMDKYSDLMTQNGFNADASAHALKKVWGDEFQQNVNAARLAFDEFAPSDMDMSDPIFNHPTVIRLLSRIGQEMSEDSQSQVKGKSSRANGMSEEQIREVQTSSDYWNNPQKQEMVRQWYEKKYR